MTELKRGIPANTYEVLNEQARQRKLATISKSQFLAREAILAYCVRGFPPVSDNNKEIGRNNPEMVAAIRHHTQIADNPKAEKRFNALQNELEAGPETVEPDTFTVPPSTFGMHHDADEMARILERNNRGGKV